MVNVGIMCLLQIPIKPIKKMVMVFCTAATCVLKSAAMAGKLGKYMSIDNGPKATKALSKTIKNFEGCFMV